MTTGIHSRKSLLAACFTAAAAAALVSSPVEGAVVYDEAISGDLSNDGLAPTSIAFGVGDNIVQGTTGHDQAGAIDRDYFTFTIGQNQTLTAIDVLNGTTVLGLFSFIGLQSGSQVTLPTDAATAAGLLGWTHYDSGDVGTDILDDMSVAVNGSSGFTRPLGPGNYSIWLQEISPGSSVPFGFNFVVGQVPEPSSWAMMLAGFGLIGLTLRRRRVQKVEQEMLG
jgi:hypothetical protein